MYSYNSKVGFINTEIGNNIIPNREIPKNIIMGVPIHGFIPKFNMRASKAELFEAMGLWENSKGIGVRGQTYILTKEGEQFVYKTDNKYIIAYNVATPILAGDVILLNGVRLNVIEAKGVLGKKGFTIDLKLDLVLVQKVNVPYITQNLILTSQSQQEKNIRQIIGLILLDHTDFIYSMMTAFTLGSANGGGPVIYPGQGAAFALKESMKADNIAKLRSLNTLNSTLQETIEVNKEWL